jgi:hypothetical protein
VFERRLGGADHAGARSEPARDKGDRTPGELAGVPLDRGEHVGAAADAAAEDGQGRVEQGVNGDHGEPQCDGLVVEDAPGRRVARRGAVEDLLCGKRPARARRVLARHAAARRRFLEGTPMLIGPVEGVGTERQSAELAGRAGGAPLQPAARHDAHADARSDGDEGEVGVPAAGAAAVLAERREVDVCILVAAIAGPFNVWTWCGSATVFFALVTYGFVHVANFNYYRRFKRTSFHWFWNAVVPAIGLVVICYALYKSFFKGLWSAGFAHGQSIVLFALAWSLIGAAYIAWLRRSRPEALQEGERSAPPLAAAAVDAS